MIIEVSSVFSLRDGRTNGIRKWTGTDTTPRASRMRGRGPGEVAVGGTEVGEQEKVGAREIGPVRHRCIRRSRAVSRKHLWKHDNLSINDSKL